ncbi:MAG TPA: glucan biosynthesis protein G [Methylomirabilota bacterium]|nr:glucan biosynthesis protein G [Methylomirabilota bacterium]
MWRCFMLAAVLALTGKISFGAESAVVDLDYVAKRALERAQKPFHSPRADLPKVLRQDNLDYDKYREIRFRREKALWTEDNLPFRIEFFHPGYLYQEPVHINEFTATHLQPIRFVQDFFNYGKLDIADQIPSRTGYAGFRILYPLNKTNQLDELGAFLGASYFRLLGKDQRYGQSARGLALNSGELDRPEEFPIFTDWWLGKPEKDDKDLVLYGLLDSVSCAGAYEFHIHPGETTLADVDVILFFRDKKQILAANTNAQPIKTIGLAPLTSMFWFGKNSERKFDDYRLEVHDADGLLMKMGNGETLWRPLDNPSVLRHQIFYAPDIKGFGFLQREREFAAYQDSFNPFDREPSVWVEPRGNWGEGDLHLLELSANWEGLDNEVAFWDPKNKPAPLQPFKFGYTLCWQMGEPDAKLSENRVVATRVGIDVADTSCRQFIIDFKGPKLDALTADNPPKVISNCSTNAVLVNSQVLPCPELKTWRVALKMQPKPGNKDPVDLRCTLQNGTNILSETWTYQWSPP